MPGYMDGGVQKFDIPDYIEVPWEGEGHFYHKAYPFDMNGDGAHNVLDIVNLANCVLAQNCG